MHESPRASRAHFQYPCLIFDCYNNTYVPVVSYLEALPIFYHLLPPRDQRVTSPHNINTFSSKRIERRNKLIRCNLLAGFSTIILVTYKEARVLIGRDDVTPREVTMILWCTTFLKRLNCDCLKFLRRRKSRKMQLVWNIWILGL